MFKWALDCFLLLSVTVLVRNPGYNSHNLLLWHPWRHIRIRRGEGDTNYCPECQLWLSDGQPGLDLRVSEGAYTVCQPQPEQSWHFQRTTWLLNIGISLFNPLTVDNWWVSWVCLPLSTNKYTDDRWQQKFYVRSSYYNSLGNLDKLKPVRFHWRNKCKLVHLGAAKININSSSFKEYMYISSNKCQV